jgi:beta-lactamase regulating signal transducer with metallopeptidase domain
MVSPMASMTSAIEALLRQPAAQIVGWALVHFVWQGALIGGLTALALSALRRSAADVRYVVATIAMSLMITLPVVTAGQMWRAESRTTVLDASATSAINPGVTSGGAPPSSSCQAACDGSGLPRLVAGAESRVDAAASRTSRAAAAWVLALNQAKLDPWLPLFVLGWLCGVTLLTLRLLSGWICVQRMKTRGTAAAGECWQEMAGKLARRLHISRRIRLLESSMVDVPTVIGWIKPVVLLPASALAGLTPHQLEAILAHELAHIRRHDYLVNLLQTLVETLLFYHPAVWWLSRRIRVERENCCDDLAVSLCGDPYTYATALTNLEELRGAKGQLVMAATGGSLVERVRRLLGAPTHAGRAPGWLAGTATVLLMLGIGAGAVGGDALQPAARPIATPPGAIDHTATRAALAVNRGAGQDQPADRAREMAAAAERLNQEAVLLDRAAAAATWLQRATHEATTPFIAGQTLAARAAALRGAAGSLQVQAESMSGGARAESEAALSAIDAARQPALPAVASTTISDSPHLSALSAIDAARAAAWPALASAPEPLAASAAALQGSAGRNQVTMSWSNNGEKLEVKADGEVEFTDDDTDVKRLSPGGALRLKDGGFLPTHTIEFTADTSGVVSRRFWLGMSERPFEPEGRLWAAKMLPRIIRQTGIGAAARVARIYKAKGTAGVLAEISLIDGSWGKRTYFTQLLKTATLDAASARQVLAQAGREIDSDFELASLLIDSADKLLLDDGTRQAYFEAARTIESDFELRRVFSSLLKRGAVGAPLLAGILDASHGIDSDFEEASLLIEVVRRQPLDAASRAPFFAALGTVGSDFEHRRVLSALAERKDLAPDTATAMLVSAGSVHSDSEAASFLLQIASQQPIEGALRAPFFEALGSIDSAFERARVLQAVVARKDVSNETILAVLRTTATMKSGFEASQILVATAAAHPIAGPARDAYIDAAEKLGDFEQGRVLAALVRNERRK